MQWRPCHDRNRQATECLGEVIGLYSREYKVCTFIAHTEICHLLARGIAATGRSLIYVQRYVHQPILSIAFIINSSIHGVSSP